MPTYCFICDQCGERVDVQAGMGSAPRRKRCRQCGAAARRDYHAEHTIPDAGDMWNISGGFTNERHETGSLSRAVHTDQVAEQMTLDKQKGVHRGVEWRSDGRGLARPHFSSKRARDNWDRAHGFVSESHY